MADHHVDHLAGPPAAALTKQARESYFRVLESFGADLGNERLRGVEKLGTEQKVTVADRWSAGRSELFFLDLNGDRIANLPKKHPRQHL